MRRMYGSLATALVALFVSASATDAQTIGFKLGAAFPNLSVEDATGLNRFTSFTGGGHIRFGFAGRAGLQLELLTVTKGSDVTDPDFTGEIRLEYVEIPVLLHVPLTMGMSFAPYVFGGPSIGFEVRCRFRPEGGTSTDCGDDDFGSFRSTDIGLVAGGGLGFAAGPGALLLEGRYNWGLTNLNDSDGPTIRTRTPSVMIGYEIPLGRAW